MLLAILIVLVDFFVLWVMAAERKSITLEQKQKVIRRMDEGQRNSVIGRSMGLHASTVRAIYRLCRQLTAKRLSKLSLSPSLVNSSPRFKVSVLVSLYHFPMLLSICFVSIICIIYV